jgi:hypothetical protein
MTGMMLGSILARFGGTLTIRRFGFRRALLLTAILTAAATMIPATFRNSTPAIFIVTTLVAGGFFRAAHFVPASALAFAEVAPEDVSKASTLSTVIQQISLGFGISVAGLTLYLSAGEAGRLSVNDFTLSFVVLGVVTLMAVPVYLTLDRNAGANMRDQRTSLVR